MSVAFLQVALGGAIGASLRYALVLSAMRFTALGFPIGVLGANIIGSFLMGFFLIYAEVRGFVALTPFIMTGVLGGFTTFSAFSLETFNLIERGQFGSAALYMTLSVVASVLALFMGVSIARGIFA
ncbi:fluoride efflux transporter CrcB [Halocynthiibacter styelae]|uniref:Fluoride-specific ion channel FluC n=1 Tax=Halocynthiibacter styelae TaxID=2761955 RepID=A0A8J7J474_9RHOB|nr:fluoride efflux transporter CrcB [Paenihalocynthiibacter styelae]MBI1493005.1 fluoride efflux transporter CrcB [Paenihalocynthiibacter styelae]